MLRRTVLKGIAATAAGSFIARPAVAADTVLKIGMSMPMTGAGFAAVGRQLKAAIQLYMQQHGDTVAGRKIELTMRDDGGVADNARRIIQEMIVNDKVDIVGIGITPTALAIAPLVTEAKKATLVMSSGASITTTKSPYFVRAGFILSPQSWIMGEWAFKNGSKKVVTLVNDWAPGIEAETAFKTRFTQVGRVNGERMRANVIEAAEQCGILSLADVEEPVPLDRYLNQRAVQRLLVFCDEAAEVSDPVLALQETLPTPDGVDILIGPEGGFAEEERPLLLRQPKILRLALGPRILRADTAGVAALALVQAVLGDWAKPGLKPG